MARADTSPALTGAGGYQLRVKVICNAVIPAIPYAAVCVFRGMSTPSLYRGSCTATPVARHPSAISFSSYGLASSGKIAEAGFLRQQLLGPATLQARSVKGVLILLTAPARLELLDANGAQRHVLHLRALCNHAGV